MQLRKLVSLWLPALLWMGLIFYLSSRPGLKVAEGPADFWTRKPAHVGEYAILFLLFFRALKGSFPWGRREVYLSAGAFSFFYAAFDELHQLFVPLREGKLTDLVFDLLGIVVGALLIYLFQNKRRGESS